GAGESAFISGADISEFESRRTGDATHDYDAAGAMAIAALLNLDKPLIALIHGFCVGGGVAIPHAFVPEIDSPVVGAFILKRPIQFGTTESERAKHVFFLVGKDGNPDKHLPILARIARLCATPEFLQVLGKSKTGRDMYKTILNWDKRISVT
ncbi:MAG: PTS sugar transporter subunit IIA, partial [Candidatus Krumholzibacteriota bacterium]|nr:PTS sugar transporter subunit IIA [Candidatus Krumholzibacteriota bacterium]